MSYLNVFYNGCSYSSEIRKEECSPPIDYIWIKVWKYTCKYFLLWPACKYSWNMSKMWACVVLQDLPLLVECVTGWGAAQWMKTPVWLRPSPLFMRWAISKQNTQIIQPQLHLTLMSKISRTKTILILCLAVNKCQSNMSNKNSTLFISPFIQASLRWRIREIFLSEVKVC